MGLEEYFFPAVERQQYINPFENPLDSENENAFGYFFRAYNPDEVFDSIRTKASKVINGRDATIRTERKINRANEAHEYLPFSSVEISLDGVSILLNARFRFLKGQVRIGSTYTLQSIDGKEPIGLTRSETVRSFRYMRQLSKEVDASLSHFLKMRLDMFFDSKLVYKPNVEGVFNAVEIYSQDALNIVEHNRREGLFTCLGDEGTIDYLRGLSLLVGLPRDNTDPTKLTGSPGSEIYLSPRRGEDISRIFSIINGKNPRSRVENSVFNALGYTSYSPNQIPCTREKPTSNTWDIMNKLIYLRV